MRTEASGYKITKVNGRRFPWRVHHESQQPWSLTALAFETEEEARTVLGAQSKPFESVRAEIGR